MTDDQEMLQIIFVQYVYIKYICINMNLYEYTVTNDVYLDITKVKN